MKSNPRAGQFKLRGKLSKALSCGCCDAFNFKHNYFWRIAGREQAEDEAADTVEEREFYRSPKAKTWIDAFDDTVFPVFEEPTTWNPNA